jgi:uncharacterized protein (TIRG00374 family)
MRFNRWYYFLSPLNHNISIKQHLLIYFSGFALTTTPAKAGETVRSLFLTKLNIKVSQSLAAFFSERLLDVLAVTILALLTLTSMNTDLEVTAYVAGVVILAVFILFKSKALEFVTNYLLKEKSKKFLLTFEISVRKFLSNKSLGICIPLSTLAWTAQGYGLYILVSSLGLDVSPWLIVGVYNLSILIGALSFIPGGVIATEASISFLLISLGMDESLAIAASILCRAMTLWFAIFIGLICLLIIGRNKSILNMSLAV